MDFFKKIFERTEESRFEKTPQAQKIEQGKERLKGPEKFKDELLTNEEALLYQDYATKMEGKGFSQKAENDTYEEADQLIELLRDKKFDFLNIDWKKFDLKNTADYENLQERLDATVRMIASTQKGEGLMAHIRQYGKVIIPLVVAAKLLTIGIDANAQDTDKGEKISKYGYSEPLDYDTGSSQPRSEPLFDSASSMVITENTTDKKQYDFKAYMPYKDAEGHFSWKAILEPFAVAFEKDKEQQRMLHFDIPYEYARLFDTGKPINPEDYNKLNNYVKEQLEKELKSAIYAFSFDEENYKKKYPGEFKPEDIKISGISLVGYASPEARNKGSERIGAIDQENIDLGNIRAENANQRLAEVFKDLGIPYEPDATKIQSTELQFSDQEFEALETLAGRMDTTVFELLKDYNANKIEDENTIDAMNKIVGEKRKVGVMIEMKDGNQKVVVIPLPLLIAIPLAFPFMRRLRNQPNRIPNSPGPVEPSSPIEPANPITQETAESLQPLPPKEIEKRNRLEMPQMEQILEFYRLDTLRDVVHNPNTYLEIARKFKDHEIKDEDEAINSLAYEILQKWMDIDREAREKVGLQGENYFERPHQVMFAIFHAAVVKGFITEMKEGKEVLEDDPVKTFHNIQVVVEREFERFRKK